MAILKGGDLYTALNVSNITTLLDTYLTFPAIFTDATIAPQAFTGTDFINFYLVEPVNPNMGYQMFVRSVNCHAATDKESKAIAIEVMDTLNRESPNGGLMYCEMLATLPPGDDTDVYNTPVTVTIKV